jgi:Amt family ammonium transporter
MLGGASGAVAGLVAVTPAVGVSGPLGAILLGGVSAAACYAFVAKPKNRLRWDDSLDVFGIHGLGGIVGSLGTALAALPALGGFGPEGMEFWPQLGRQSAAVLVAVLWSGIGSAIAFGVVKSCLSLRHDEDAEREGLDISDHGERAYG